ncbi:hypothetical protein ACJ72_08179 [Emergomyces africanus]|uniref:Hpc2-related domain-containing protein n=1 Tax=Emergomyces africanus TaxID=1955775 RepID=A0A1B7NL70_9EURO|nr:hypothetical protein ACJ72_08179 [Emergomyces africanus]
MSADVADEGWRGRGRTRRGEQTLNSQPPAQPQLQSQPQLQMQQQVHQQLEHQLQQQHLPPAKILKSSSPDLSSPNLSDCETVPTPAHFRSRAASPNVAAQDTSASTNLALPVPSSSKNVGDAEVKSEKQEVVAAAGTTTKVKRTRRKKEDKEPKEKNKETIPRRRRTSNIKNNNSNNNNDNPGQAQNQQLSITNDDNADRGASRKRAKLDHPQEIKPNPPSRQPKITDLVTPLPAPAPVTPSTLSPTHAASSPKFHFAPSSTSTSPRLQPQHQPHHAHGIAQSSNYDAFPANGSSRPPFRPYHIQPAPSSAPALAPISAPVSNPAPGPAPNLAPPLLQQQQPQQPHPPQRSSGQNYDPIRSAFDNSSIPAPQFSASSKISLPSSHQFSPPPNTRTPPPRPVYRASASPAISSIIDPPIQPSTSAPPQSGLSHQQCRPSPENNNSVKHSPSSVTPTSTTTNANTTTIQQPKALHQPLLPSSLLQEPVTMDIDSGNNENNEPTPVPSVPSKLTANAPNKKGTGASTGPPSTAPSPKPPRAKDTARPPLPSGSGLLAGTLFGVETTNTSSNSTSTKSTPNIILHVPLNGKTNQIINFTRLAEQQYGFDALHPRLAAQRERLARVSAASAALERNEKNAKGGGTDSAAEDDLSLDADRDSDGDGDVLMSGMGGGSSTLNGHGDSIDAGAGAGASKKKRRRKIEEYDRDDPFVDDSELAWQEHAAASKDGFFVYSGPLIPEGEKVAVERADGSIKRGRGRGRGVLPVPLQVQVAAHAARGGGASNAGQNQAGSSGHDGGGTGGGAAVVVVVVVLKRWLNERGSRDGAQTARDQGWAGGDAEGEAGEAEVGVGCGESHCRDHAVL